MPEHLDAPSEFSPVHEDLTLRAQELLTDIGQVLHANTTLLVMTQQTLIATAEALGAEMLGGNSIPDMDEFDEQLVALARRLESALMQFIASVPAERRNEILPRAQQETFARDAALLREIRERVPVAEMRVPTLRKVAHTLVHFTRTNAAGKFSREQLRNLRDPAEELERRAVLFDVAKTQNAVLQMDVTLRSLRDYLTSGMHTVQRERFAMREVLEDAIRQLADYSRNSRVEIVWRQRVVDAFVDGNRRDMTRAMTNILHNAIKYTWRRDRSRAPWVKLTTVREADHIVIAIENWGVPIERDELDRELVFQLGYRGRQAHDRGRLGTGIGLTDARRVVEAHGGTLTIDSVTADPSARMLVRGQDYAQPFITTVTVRLPLG